MDFSTLPRRSRHRQARQSLPSSSLSRRWKCKLLANSHCQSGVQLGGAFCCRYILHSFPTLLPGMASVWGLELTHSADRLGRFKGEAPGMLPVTSANPATQPCALPHTDSHAFFSKMEQEWGPKCGYKAQQTVRSYVFSLLLYHDSDSRHHSHAPSHP